MSPAPRVELRVGDVVRNDRAPSWGRGVVTAVDGTKVRVRFEHADGGELKVLDRGVAALSLCPGEPLAFLPAEAQRRVKRTTRDPGSDQHFWIVKGRDERTDWEDMERGQLWHWVTGRPPRLMRIGDGVFFWRATPHCCIVGIGEIASLPEWPPPDGAYRYGIRALSGLVENPLWKPELLRDPVVGAASFLKLGMASGIVSLHELEAKRLAALLREQNGSGAVAPWWGDAA